MNVKQLSWFVLILLFAIPTMLNIIACRIAIPYLHSLNILPIEVSYFISVGLLVLAPMFFGAIYLSGREVNSYKLKTFLPG